MKNIDEIIKRQRERNKESKKLDETMDKILGNKSEKAVFIYQHSDVGCPECRERDMDFYLGTTEDGVEIHRYKCECGHEEETEY